MLTYWPKYLSREKFNQFAIFAEDGPLVNIIGNLGLRVECFVGLKGFKGFTQLPKLISFIKNNKVDIIHAHGARVNLWGSFASLLTGVPIIATEHNIDLWRINNHLFNGLDRFSAKINKCRVGVSQAVCAMLRKQGVRADKIVCIENGIDVERFNITVDISDEKAGLGIPDSAKVIGAVGRLVEQKGHKYLIEAFKIIEDQFSNVRLMIVGDGPLEYTLKEQVKDLGLEGKVIFAGQREDIPYLLAAMDIFVLPSITEGLPLVLLEAMAAGKPVIASRISGIPEVIEDGVDGVLVEPANADVLASAIKNLLSDSSRSVRMAALANNKVNDKYTAKNMLKRYQALYERILSDSAN